MRKYLLVPAVLVLAGCGTDDAEPEPTHSTPPVVAEDTFAPPLTQSPDSTMTAPPKPGPNTITITATSASDGEAHWGDINNGVVTPIPAGSTWSETFEGVDATDYWTITVMGDFVSESGDVSCTIEVDGEIVDEVAEAGTGASAFCSATDY